MDLRLCVALVSCLNLLIHVQSSDAVANFTKVPNETLYLANGKTARFTWDFHVDNIKKELDSGSPRWYFYANSTTYWIGYGDAFNGRKFTIDTNTCPARFLRPTVRVSVEGKATLVIKNLTLADSGTYGCILFLAKGPDRLMPTSHVKLIVTGPPGSPVLKIVKFTNTTVTLMWSKPEENGGEIEYYTIYKKLAGAKKWLQVGTLSGEPLTYTVKELLPGKTYSFHVTAKNKDGPSLKGVNVKTVTLPIGSTNPPTTRSIGTIKVGLLTASLALVILLMLLIVVFISWKKRKKHDRRNNQNEDAVYCNVNAHGMTSFSSSANQPVLNIQVGVAPQGIPERSDVPFQNQTHGNTEMRRPNQEHYQQLSLDIVHSQKAAAPRYEPLRKTFNDTDESYQHDTYQSLCNCPSVYQSLHTN